MNQLDKTKEDEKSPQRDTIYQHMTIITYVLGQTPSFWVDLLDNDEIDTQQNQICINHSLTITKIYKRFKKEVEKILKEKDEKFDFQR